MKSRLLLIVLIQIISAQRDLLVELAEKGDCKFYQVMESMVNCGPKGYLISYGYKYCNKFTDDSNSFNQDGQLWIKSVKKCLMKKLLKLEFKSCESLTDYAFDSHVDCYLNPGGDAKSFCSIFFGNALALTKVYDFKDFLTEPYRSFKQIFDVLFKCLGFKYRAIDNFPIF